MLQGRVLVFVASSGIVSATTPTGHDSKEVGMFEMGTSAVVIVGRTALVYVGLLAGLRVAGKRELGQMTVFDLVVILLIANAVQNAMTGPDFSVQGGLIAAAVLLAMNRLIAVFRTHNEAWGRLLEGMPTVLVQDGQFLEPRLRKEGLERSQIEMAIREHGIEDLGQVRLAVLETDGSISVVPASSPVVKTRRHVRQIRL
jgi:uncharacterized membrane protein YcaP (DUF421 family)